MIRARASLLAGALAAATLAHAGPAGPGSPHHAFHEALSLSIEGLEALPRDPGNRKADDAAAADLGHRLFFDARLSANGRVSCASCHDPRREFQDGIALAKGAGTTDRRTMPVAASAYSPFLFWDGRKDSLWAQALGPLESAVEHGGSRAQYAHVVASHYRREYERVFGPLPDLQGVPPAAGPVDDPAARAAWERMAQKARDAVTGVFVNIGKAIAAYERRIQYGPSRFDRFVAEWKRAGTPPREVLNADEQAGFALCSLALALMMSVVGPVSGNHVSTSVSQELVRRNAETMRSLNTFIGTYTKEWNEFVQRVPKMAQLPADTEKQLGQIADAGKLLYPSLLALESIVALALAWSVYHRIARARLGPPLGALRDFRFNDQLVWGLIVGLTIVFLPTLSSVRILGRNLLVFFGALYAVRGLGVLSWFMAPGALAISATVGFVMLLLPVLNAIAVLGFMFLGIAAFGLGLGDTWADWRNRARRSTT